MCSRCGQRRPAAIAVSNRTVAGKPAATLVWTVLTAVGFATFLPGLVIVRPLLGHAMGAYRDLIR